MEQEAKKIECGMCILSKVPFLAPAIPEDMEPGTSHPRDVVFYVIWSKDRVLLQLLCIFFVFWHAARDTLTWKRAPANIEPSSAF